MDVFPKIIWTDGRITDRNLVVRSECGNKPCHGGCSAGDLEFIFQKMGERK